MIDFRNGALVLSLAVALIGGCGEQRPKAQNTASPTVDTASVLLKAPCGKIVREIRVPSAMSISDACALLQVAKVAVGTVPNDTRLLRADTAAIVDAAITPLIQTMFREIGDTIGTNKRWVVIEFSLSGRPYNAEITIDPNTHVATMVRATPKRVW